MEGGKKKLLIILILALFSFTLISASQNDGSLPFLDRLKILFGINNIPNQCFTDLQPSNYFGKSSLLYKDSTGNYLLSPLGEKITFDKNFILSKAEPTGSMRPAIGDYSIIISVKPKQEEIFVGDIVCVSDGHCHRVLNIDDGFYELKGDNNLRSDVLSYEFSDIEEKIVGVLY